MSNNSLLANNTDIVDADRSILKILLFIFAVALVAGFAGFLLEREQLLYGIIVGVVFLSLFTLQNLFIKGYDKLFLASLVESVAMSLPFYKNFSGYFVIAGLTLVILLFKASFNVRKELEASMKIRFLKISRISMNMAMPGIILFFLGLFIIRGEFLTREGVSLALEPLSPIAAKYIPKFSFEASTGELLNNIVISSLGEIETENLNKIPLLSRNKLIAESVNGFQDRIKGFVGTEISLEKSVSANVYDILNTRYNNLTTASKTILIVMIFLSLFSLIITLVPLAHIPIAILTFVMYEIFLVSGFAVVQLEPRSREIIILK